LQLFESPLGHWLVLQDVASANLDHVDLREAELTGATLTNAYMKSAYMAGANMTGANLSGANIEDGYLLNANLTNANLYYATLTGGNLANADLSGTNLGRLTLTDANLTGAILTGATLDYVTSGGITGTPAALPADWQFENGYLVGPAALLRSAVLTNADLSGARFNTGTLLPDGQKVTQHGFDVAALQTYSDDGSWSRERRWYHHHHRSCW